MGTVSLAADVLSSVCRLRLFNPQVVDPLLAWLGQHVDYLSARKVLVRYAATFWVPGHAGLTSAVIDHVLRGDASGISTDIRHLAAVATAGTVLNIRDAEFWRVVAGATDTLYKLDLMGTSRR